MLSVLHCCTPEIVESGQMMRRRSVVERGRIGRTERENTEAEIYVQNKLLEDEK